MIVLEISDKIWCLEIKVPETQNDDSHFVTSCLDLTAADDTKDTSTEFTDSIEEEVQHCSHLQVNPQSVQSGISAMMVRTMIGGSIQMLKVCGTKG